MWDISRCLTEPERSNYELTWLQPRKVLNFFSFPDSNYQQKHRPYCNEKLPNQNEQESEISASASFHQ